MCFTVRKSGPRTKPARDSRKWTVPSMVAANIQNFTSNSYASTCSYESKALLRHGRPSCGVNYPMVDDIQGRPEFSPCNTTQVPGQNRDYPTTLNLEPAIPEPYNGSAQACM